MTADFHPVLVAVLAVCNQPAPKHFSRKSTPRACVVVVRPKFKRRNHVVRVHRTGALIHRGGKPSIRRRKTSSAEHRGGGTDHRSDPARLRRGICLDGNAIRCTCARLPGGERASCGHSPDVRDDVGGRRQFVCHHRGRQRGCYRIRGFAMDFATLPPEVNSGLMYTGPGSGPMIAAAASWDNLATEVSSAAGDYGSLISGLTSGPWRGPASASMVAAAAPYVSWMNATAAQAEQAAEQAKAAASAYEAAFTATVAPPVIAANRTLLASLVATNILGQNTPAIATTEAHYAEMWAQDAAAMYGYAGSSAAASTLTPFLEPPATTTAGQATGTATSAPLSQLVTSVPAALQGLTSPATSSGSGLN